MGLFESSKNRAKRMLNGLKKAQLRLQRSINTIGTQVSKAEAQAVEAAKSGQRLQVRAAAERVHTMMRMKMEYQRRDNMLSMWILKAEHAQGDSEIAQLLSGLAVNLKVPESGLSDAIDKFGETIDRLDDNEMAWKDGEESMRQRGALGDEEGLPSVDKIMQEANDRAAAERSSLSERPVAARDTAEAEEAATLLKRAREAAKERP